MGSQLPVFRLPTSVSAYSVAGVTFAFLVLIKSLSQPSKLRAIPTVGSGSWFGSWWDGLTFLFTMSDVIQEGYRKHKLAPFKVAGLYRWIVIISSPEHIDELRKAPEDTLSFMEAVNDQIQVEYTFGREIRSNPFHVPIIRSQLTRNVRTLYPETLNEVVTAFDDLLGLVGNEWKSIPAFSTAQKIVCRITNRILIGLPLCRDPEWVDLAIEYISGAFKEGILLGLFPSFLRPTVAWFRPAVRLGQLRGESILGPIIEERRRHLEEYGNNWSEKPNDYLSWLMDEAEGLESTTKSLTDRILAVNFASIHGVVMAFTHALLYLTENPQYIQPLREEAEVIIEKQGWSKTSVDEMRKMDSFLKETLRLASTPAMTLMRIALKNFRFSDGTFIPKGTFIAVAGQSISYDERFYKDASAFKPFRFADLRDEGGEGLKHHLVSTSNDYLSFGHGVQSCPGRFFAAAELKTMLAHVLLTYDFKLPDNVESPPTHYIGLGGIPDLSARVMFRKRVK